MEWLKPTQEEAVFILLAGSVILYFLPCIVAIGRRNWVAITVLNLLTGWTGVGWIIALVWAFTKDPRK